MARCNACGAEIRFIRTEDGRQTPVEPKPITVITSLGKTIKAFVPHWTTCPGASQERKKEIHRRGLNAPSSPLKGI